MNLSPTVRVRVKTKCFVGEQIREEGSEFDYENARAADFHEHSPIELVMEEDVQRLVQASEQSEDATATRTRKRTARQKKAEQPDDNQ